MIAAAYALLPIALLAGDALRLGPARLPQRSRWR